MTYPTEEQLLAAACHIGHRCEKWNPKMKPYLYGIQKGIHVFDLTQTKKHLEKACNELAEFHRKGKTILFVSTKLFSIAALEDVGNATGQPLVTKKWIPGLVTNWKTISRRIKYYLDLQRQFKTGEVEKYTKKEQLKLRKKLAQLDKALSGVSGMTGLPDAIVVVDAVRDQIAVREANIAKIPVFGICDSNADPDRFKVAIPANDDAVTSVVIILDTIKQVLLEVGREAPKKEEKKTAEPESAEIVVGA